MSSSKFLDHHTDDQINFKKNLYYKYSLKDNKTFTNLENKKWSLLLGGALIKQNSMYKSETLESISIQLKKNDIKTILLNKLF